MFRMSASRRWRPSCDSTISKAFRTTAAWIGDNAFEKVVGVLK
jgi:hypothetical protein